MNPKVLLFRRLPSEPSICVDQDHRDGHWYFGRCAGADVIRDVAKPVSLHQTDVCHKGFGGISSIRMVPLFYSGGVTMNSSSFYMRILRAVYNRAVDSELIFDSRPFRHVYTGVDKTLKRAIPTTDISKIRGMNKMKKSMFKLKIMCIKIEQTEYLNLLL